MFSDRASPFQWRGPKRFHQPPISMEDLPPIQGVVLSHDHYDHLDQAVIRRLAAKTAYFLTPLGVGDRLIAWGVDPVKLQQLDWWQSTQVGGVELVATPAQHFLRQKTGPMYTCSQKKRCKPTWHEPFDRITALAKSKGVRITRPVWVSRSTWANPMRAPPGGGRWTESKKKPSG